jgi:glycosyltransferase involved in cell wall biosynthesis
MRGNITTVRRISRALDDIGVEVVVLPIDAMSIEEMEFQLHSFLPDVIHAFHAGYCGPAACHLAERLNVPYVITITGSDVNEDQFRDNGTTRRAIFSAAALVCFDDCAADQLANFFPGITGRICIIHQGIASLPVDAEDSGVIPDDAFMLFLPAALRPVKNIEFPLRALASLVQNNNRVMLVIAGGAIDQAYADDILEAVAGASYAIWLGEVPYERMGALYMRADVVLNCSHYEGMPNSLLEAMALSRPVLAADIPGNHSLIRDNETGWLYAGEDDFRSVLLRLIADPVMRSKVGEKAGEFVQSQFSPCDESIRYVELYSALLKM